MQKEPPNEKMVPSGLVVTEFYDREFRVSDDLREEFEKNPERVLKNFLTQQGMKVNSVSIIRRGSGKATKARKITGWFHVVYPLSWQSRWIYVENF
jgi:hypothetical protein